MKCEVRWKERFSCSLSHALNPCLGHGAVDDWRPHGDTLTLFWHCFSHCRGHCDYWGHARAIHSLTIQQNVRLKLIFSYLHDFIERNHLIFFNMLKFSIKSKQILIKELLGLWQSLPTWQNIETKQQWSLLVQEYPSQPRITHKHHIFSQRLWDCDSISALVYLITVNHAVCHLVSTQIKYCQSAGRVVGTIAI